MNIIKVVNRMRSESGSSEISRKIFGTLSREVKDLLGEIEE